LIVKSLNSIVIMRINTLPVLLLASAGLSLAAIEITHLPGFRMCKDTPQHLQLLSVEVDGKGCERWPCLLFPGRAGRFRITLRNQHDRFIKTLVTDIHGTVRIKGVPGAVGGKQKVGMPGEVKAKACPHTDVKCPIVPYSTFSITKEVVVPMQARMAHGRMVTEFKVKDGAGNILTCFRAPVRLG